MATFQIGSRPPPSFEDPVGVMAHCHRRIEQKLAAIPRIVVALRAGEEEALPALEEVLRYFEHGARRHHEDEEYSVFPRLAGDESRPLLEQITSEHRTNDAIYLAFRTVAKRILDMPAEGGTLADELAMHGQALAEAYKAHIALEEESLFPLVKKLEDKELRAIGLEMRLRRGGEDPR